VSSSSSVPGGGPIPTEVGRLTRLTHLTITQGLTGTLPTGLAQLTGLTFLNLSASDLNGTIPTDLSLLTELRHLELSDNDLIGTIPTELALLSHLTSLRLSGLSQMTGSVPSGLCRLLRSNGGFLNLSIDCNAVNCSCVGGCDCSSPPTRF